MTNMPWGPHGPVAPPNSVLPNPTAADPPQQIGGGGNYAAPMAAGAGGAGSGFFANIVLSLILFALLWIPMVCLYPLTALAGIMAGFGTASVLRHLFPVDLQDVASVAGFLAGVAVVWKVYRIEYRLAEQPDFRRARHAVRMVLLAIWAIPIIQLSMGATAPTTSTRYILAVVTHPGAMLAFLVRPQNFVIWGAAVAGLHFLLWKGERPRAWWHRRLVFLGLK